MEVRDSNDSVVEGVSAGKEGKRKRGCEKDTIGLG